MVLVFFAVNTVGFITMLSARRLQEAAEGWGKGAKAVGGFVEPVLRSAGISRYVLELSEVQVRDLAVGSDVHVSFQMSGQPDQRTEAVQAPQSSILRFRETFMLKVR